MANTNRWFTLPIVLDESDPADPVRRPKYVEREGIEGYSGNTVARSLTDHLPDLPDQARSPSWNFYDELFVARIYGDEMRLEEIAEEPDVFALSMGGRAAERVPTAMLNARFGDQPDRDDEGWQRGFRVGGNE